MHMTCLCYDQEALSGSLDLNEAVGNNSSEETTPKKMFSPRYSDNIYTP